jgi:hypothetical protein
MRGRVGKIARLPGAVRHELNRRLHNGALGWELVPWLNALPEVQHVLTQRFANRPITEDNLSEWRRGGFQDWLVHEERRVRLRELTADQNDDPEQNTHQLNVRIQEQLAVKLAEELERVSVIADQTERFKILQSLSREVCRLYRAHTRDRELQLFELKTTDEIQPDSNPFQPHSAPFGPSRTKQARG